MTDVTDAPSANPAVQARRPLQKRSRERFQLLLDATDALLTDREAFEIGLYDIAEQAGVPPGSVYHFFPTKEAALVALAERYLERLYQVTRVEPPDLTNVRNWPDFVRSTSRRASNYYNDHPVLMKLFLSGGVSAEVRRLDVDYVKNLSKGGYDWFSRFFDMPYIPDSAMRFSIIWAIFDGITTASFMRHGKITEDYFEELVLAITAYCRTFLPEVLPMRPPSAVAGDVRPA